MDFFLFFFFLTFNFVLWRRQWQPTPVLLPGKSHGQRSLVGCSPWGHEESDMTEQLHFHFSLSCIGEGNGNPLQYSCLENPRDGGAWWAAVSGVTQSQTRLKRLSSSSSSSSSSDIWRDQNGLWLSLITSSLPTSWLIFPGILLPQPLHRLFLLPRMLLLLLSRFNRV